MCLRVMTDLENLLVAKIITCFRKTGLVFFPCLFVSCALFAFVFNYFICNYCIFLKNYNLGTYNWKPYFIYVRSLNSRPLEVMCLLFNKKLTSTGNYLVKKIQQRLLLLYDIF